MPTMARPGYRRLDAQARRSQGKGKVALKGGDPVDAHARAARLDALLRGAPIGPDHGLAVGALDLDLLVADLPARLDAELRDGRTLVDLHDGGIDTKARERIDDELRTRGVVVLAITAGLGLLQEFNGRQLPAALFLEGELLGLLLAVGIRQVVPGFLPRVVGLGFRRKGKLILHQGSRDGWRDAIDMGRSRRDPGAEDDGGGFEGHRGARSGSFEGSCRR